VTEEQKLADKMQGRKRRHESNQDPQQSLAEIISAKSVASPQAEPAASHCVSTTVNGPQALNAILIRRATK
jgi:hypothetical protein